MAWDEATNSTAVFRAYLADLLAPLDVLSGAFANIDRYKLACFNATVTPDRNATAVASTYASAGWPAAAEVIDTGPNGLWPVGGNMRRFDVRPAPDRVAVTMAPYTVGPVTMGAPAGDFLYEHGIGPLAPVAGPRRGVPLLGRHHPGHERVADHHLDERRAVRPRLGLGLPVARTRPPGPLGVAEAEAIEDAWRPGSRPDLAPGPDRWGAEPYPCRPVPGPARHRAGPPRRPGGVRRPGRRDRHEGAARRRARVSRVGRRRATRVRDRRAAARR